MKLWERGIKRRLRRDISIWENQFGFMPYRSTTKAINITRKLMELYEDRKTDLYMVFIGCWGLIVQERNLKLLALNWMSTANF